MRAAPPQPASPPFGPMQHGRAVAITSSPRGRSPPKKLVAGTWSTGSASGKVCTPAPAPRHRSPADHRVCVVVAELWCARGRGAALGRRHGQPAAAAAAGVREYNRCGGLVAPQEPRASEAASRSPGAAFFGLERSNELPFQLKAGGCRLHILHHRCWDEAPGARRVRRGRCRPVGWSRARTFVLGCRTAIWSTE